MTTRLHDTVAQGILGALDPHRLGKGDPITEPLGTREGDCPEHGVYIATGTRYTIGRRREVWTPCQACVEKQKAEEQEAKDLQRLQREQERLAELVGRAAIPTRYLGRGFDTYRADGPKQLRVLTRLRDYAEHFDEHARTGESLFMIGNRGTGKTHLAVAVLQAIMPAHCGLYTTASDVVAMVRETWRKDSERSQEQVLGMLARVPLLVIDEVGVQYGTEGEKNILFQVIDRRYRDRRPMILMANLTSDEVEGVMGERNFDRLREIAGVVKCEWDSYRLQARRDAMA